jgi:uncharacterized Tic20 family protein
MYDNNHGNGVCTFTSIMVVSFFVFAFINGAVHSIVTTPTPSSEAVLQFTSTMMPIIILLTLFALLWMLIGLFRAWSGNVRCAD